MEFADILSVFKLDVMQFAETISQCMKSEGVGDVTGKSFFRLSTDWMQQPLRYSPSVGRGRFNHKLVLDAPSPPPSDWNQQHVLPTTQNFVPQCNIKMSDCGNKITLIS